MSFGINKIISSEKQNAKLNITPRLSKFSYLTISWRTAPDSTVIASSTM